ncbi:glycosyltransferase family 2 protein [Microbulbifer sp. OS29]|uniref:Glycosyltransferase family 2 protein n=1 Tax=Microbulbifer okhotskensis TaxID=2926617 RepID=A0A9X2EMM8_9GAMM|nr:glycosyltransferase family 2 protein [Microbulbifer okhotskensis]MCO1334479.1 glycosyltransferase family 2 protein [Microbulbifer okhotskensis]
MFSFLKKKISLLKIPHLYSVDLRYFIPYSKNSFSGYGDNELTAGPSGASFNFSGVPLPKGWYMLELFATSSQSYLDLNFPLEHSGTRKAIDQFFPIRSGRLAKRLIWLPRGGETLSISINSANTRLTFNKLLIKRVSRIFAMDRMKSHLSRRKLDSSNDIERLWVRYNSTFRAGGARIYYYKWIKDLENKLLQSYSSGVKEGHVISILMPVGPLDKINRVMRSIASIYAQHYKSWNLIVLLSDGVSTETSLQLHKFSECNKKLRIKNISDWRECTSTNQNSYFLVFPPRALLSEHALSILNDAIVARPDGHIFYADEDLINESGRRGKPIFKPAWNPDLLYSTSYIREFVLFRASVLQSAGTPNIVSDTAWDLTLFLTAIGNPEGNCNILHVPRILYHRFSLKHSPGYIDSAKMTVYRYISSSYNSDVNVCIGDSGSHLDILWKVPKPEPLVSLLIPTRNQLDVLKKCVLSILGKTAYSNYEIIILDNQSDDPNIHEFFKEISFDGRVRVIPFNEPFNYSKINNFGVFNSNGSIVGLINNDVEVITPGWLTEMVGHALRPEIGCVGAKLYYNDRRIQHAGVVVGLGGLAGHVHKFHEEDSDGYMGRLKATQNYLAVTAACLLIRKEVFEEVGGLNEIELKVAFNDVDLCLKVAQAGYRNLWTPNAELYHHESVSRGMDDTREKRARFEKEAKYLKEIWVNNLEVDPCYSPFLTHLREDFSLGLNEYNNVPIVR